MNIEHQKREILKAYCWIRENNQSIPDDILDLMKESAITALQKHADLEKRAESYANNEGYPQSDKTHFETTYWTQHNIAAKAFIAGWRLKEAQN